jgi:broad specificity phosphatase PhoE
MRLFLVRHGEVASNLRKVYAGRSDELLTDRGVSQAQHAAELLFDRAIEIIYASPLRRTMQTADILALPLRVPVVPEAGLTELQMGCWEGKSEEEVAAQYPDEWQTWQTNPTELRLPGRETLQDLYGRVLNAVQRIAARNHQRGIVLVTHYAIIRVILLHVRGKPLSLYKTISVPNCEPFELEM